MYESARSAAPCPSVVLSLDGRRRRVRVSTAGGAVSVSQRPAAPCPSLDGRFFFRVAVSSGRGAWKAVEAGSESRSSQLGRAARTEDRRGLRQGRRDMAAGAPRLLQVPVTKKARFPLQLGPSDVLVERKCKDGSSQSNLAEPERAWRVQEPTPTTWVTFNETTPKQVWHS